MAFKLHPLSAASFSSTPFSFYSAGVISVPESEVAMAARACSRSREHQDRNVGNARLKTGLVLSSSASTPGDFLLLNNALNEI